MRRPPRGYRQLTRRIFELATLAFSRRRFIREITRLLADFAACEIVEIWLRFKGRHQEGWAYSIRDDVLCPLGQIPPGPAGVNDEEVRAVESAGEAPHGSSARLEFGFGDEIDGELSLHSNHPDYFSDSKLALYQDVASDLSVAIAYHHAQFSQRERVKELACLYQIAQIANQPDLSLSQILQQVVEILPEAWQYPDICVARIELDDLQQDSGAFRDVEQTLRSPIQVAGGDQGWVSVGYVDKMPPQDEGPFLGEERKLIETVATELARIAERKQSETEQHALRDQIQHADRLATIGQLAAGVAHELNEPLGSILGFAQLSKKTSGLPEQVQSDLARIEAAALHSRKIVKKLNLFARSGSQNTQATDLNQIIRDGLVFLESRLVKEGIVLELSLDESIQRIWADPGQMTQVLMNLTVNAVQAMEAGGKLTISTRPGDEEVVWCIADTGAGMAPGVMTRVFEPFYTTKDVGEGTGLGLAVVHGIVTAHGGTIQVESEPEIGSRFEIHLQVETA